MTFTNELSPPTPCLICEKALVYLEIGEEKIKETSIIHRASNFRIVCNYGSDFDTHVYEAGICDECLDKAIQRRRVAFVKSWEFEND